MPDQHLLPPSQSHLTGGAIPWLVRRKGTPPLLPRMTIERDHRATVASNHADHLILNDQWVSGITPFRNGDAIIGRQMPRPEDFTRGDLQAMQMTLGAKGVNLLCRDGRCTPGSDRIEIDRGVRRLITMFPQKIPSGHIESHDSLLAGYLSPDKIGVALDLPWIVRLGKTVHDKNLSTHHRWPRVTATQRVFPIKRHPRFRKTCANPLLAPGGIHGWPQEMGPVITSNHGRKCQPCEERKDGWHPTHGCTP